MIKKSISSLLVISIIVSLFAMINVSAAVFYTPGSNTQKVDIGKPIETNNATVSGGKLTLNGGSAKYEYIQDFDTLSVTIKYMAEEDVNISLKTDLNTENITLLKDSKEITHTLVRKTRAGSNTLVVSSEGDVTISEITLNKINYYEMASTLSVTVDYDDYDDALQSAVVVAENSTIVKVNGAKRYVNYENQNEYAINHEGRLYIPVKTAARAFSLYYEEYSDLNYVYISNDFFEFYCKDTECYSINNAVKEEIESPLIYRDGKAWIHVRFLAEKLNKTVGYRDGVAIFDDRLCVERILENSSIFEQLKAEMTEMDISKKHEGIEYHVSQAAYASDNNNGTENFPFATIQKAADIAQPGDTIIIHKGTYRETVTPKNNGTAVNPITYRAADGENVVVSALDKISGFIHYRDNIYCVSLPEELGQSRNFIVYNGKHIAEGRHPNSNTTTRAVCLDIVEPNGECKVDRTLFPTMGDILIGDELDGKKFSGSPDRTLRIWGDSDIDLDQDEEDYWKGATVNGMHSAGWTMSTGYVISSKKGHIEIQDPGVTNPYVGYGFLYYAYDFDRTARDYAYLTNHINTVDMPGEWYVDENNILYIIPPEGATGDTLEVEAKQRQRVWDLRNKEYINLVGINTIGGGITMMDAKMCVVNGGTHKYVSHWNTNISGHTTYHDTANNDPNGAPPRGECGEYISGENNAWINSVIDGSANAGIYVNGVYQYIENNEVYNTAYMGSFPSGITIECERWIPHQQKRGGITVVNNTVKYAGRGCFYNSQNFGAYNGNGSVCYPTIANDIGYNEFGYGMITSRDGGNIYSHGIVTGNDRVSSKLHHNMIYDPVSQDSVHDTAQTQTKGLYYDANCTMETAYSNMAFTSTEDPRVTMVEASAYHISGAPYTYIEGFNNVALGYRPNGLKSITAEDYPLGRPFKVGRMDIGERMMDNYNKVTLENMLYAGDCTMKGGAYIDETDIVRFTSMEDSFESKPITLPEGNKLVRFYLTGDKYNDNVNTISIDVKKNGEVIYRTGLPIGAGTSRLEDAFTGDVYLPDTVTGEVTLEISATEHVHGIAKIKIEPIAGEIPDVLFPSGSYIFLAGTFDDWIKNEIYSDIKTKRSPKGGADFAQLPVLETREHTLIYENRSIPEDTNAMRLYLATSYKYAKDGKVYIYMDGYDENSLIGSAHVGEQALAAYPDGTSWAKFSVEIDMLKNIPKGTHTFYIRFDGPGYSTDFYNFLCYNK